MEVNTDFKIDEFYFPVRAKLVVEFSIFTKGSDPNVDEKFFASERGIPCKEFCEPDFWIFVQMLRNLTLKFYPWFLMLERKKLVHRIE